MLLLNWLKACIVEWVSIYDPFVTYKYCNKTTCVFQVLTATLGSISSGRFYAVWISLSALHVVERLIVFYSGKELHDQQNCRLGHQLTF